MWWAITWIACSVAAFVLMLDAWRRDYPARLADVIFFTVLSFLGPFSLLIGLALHLPRFINFDRVIWRRK